MNTIMININTYKQVLLVYIKIMQMGTIQFMLGGGGGG
jgi:hypothetical protein